MAQPRYKRILLKLSGETLGGKGGFGLDVSAAEYIAREVKEAYGLGCEIGIVIGGGNFVRGAKLSRMGIPAKYLSRLSFLPVPCPCELKQ